MGVRIRYNGAGEFAFPLPWDPDDRYEGVLSEGNVIELPAHQAREILQRYPVVERVYEMPEGKMPEILEIRGREGE